MGTGIAARHVIRRGLTCGALTLAVLTIGTQLASAQPVIFGADLSQAPNTTIDCTGDPDGGFPITHPSSCTWAEPDNPMAPSEGFVTPAGTGTITSVRIRVGAVTGPMALVVFNFEVDPSNENAVCCNAAYVGPTFTPTANSVTTLNTDLPVHTDTSTEESAPPYQVADMLGLSVLQSGVPIPAIDELSSGLPPNEQPSDSVHWPAYVQGQTDVAGGYDGYQLDMNATWVQATGSPGPPPTNPPPPTVSVGTSLPTVTGRNVNVPLDCGAAAACAGTIAIENKPLAQATVAGTSKRIVYAKGTFGLNAGADGTARAALTSKGRTAAHKHKRLTVYIDLTVGSGTSATTTSKKVTFRF